MTHHLSATPQTCAWGYFDAALPPALKLTAVTASLLIP